MYFIIIRKKKKKKEKRNYTSPQNFNEKKQIESYASSEGIYIHTYTYKNPHALSKVLKIF